MHAAEPASRHSRAPAPRGGGLRPFARATARHRRLGRRLAAGLTPAQVARTEGVPEAEIAALLAETDLAQLADAYRALAELPEAEARGRLVVLARQLIEEAIVSGDARIAFFVLREERRGRDPARRLVDGLLAALRRDARPPTEPPPPPAPPPAAPPGAAPSPRASRPSAHPADLMARRAAARLREALAREHAVLRRAATPAPREAAEARPVAEPAAPPQPRLNRRERRRSAALRRRKAAPSARPRADRPAPRSRGP